MAKTDENVMRMVEQELAKDPDVSVEDLFAKAKGMKSGIARMTRRQFHARYPLQVKRRLGRGRKRRKTTKRGRKAGAAKATHGRGRPRVAASDGRDAVRQVFLHFAQDLTAAEARKDLWKVFQQVDRYVDEAVKAAAR